MRTFERFDEFHLTRIAQLLQRSNQFNLTTRRYSEQQIADWLGISTGSVKRHAFRATAALKKQMEAWA